MGMNVPRAPCTALFEEAGREHIIEYQPLALAILPAL